MRTSCKIIQDLLPLYHDSVCSEESCDLVQEHLEECETCKQMLKDIDSELSYTVMSEDEGEPIRAIKSVWEKSKTEAFFKGTLITIIICTILVGGFIGMTQWKFIPVSSDILKVSEVSQLSDGRIIYRLGAKDDKEILFIKFKIYEDGAYYMTPMRSLIEEKRNLISVMLNNYHIVDISEGNGDRKTDDEEIIINSCYLGPKDNGILIWEEGMELPAASEKLEEAVFGNDEYLW